MTAALSSEEVLSQSFSEDSELDFSDGELSSAEAGGFFSLTVGAIPAVAANRASFSYTCSGA